MTRPPNGAGGTVTPIRGHSQSIRMPWTPEDDDRGPLEGFVLTFWDDEGRTAHQEMNLAALWPLKRFPHSPSITLFNPTPRARPPNGAGGRVWPIRGSTHAGGPWGMPGIVSLGVLEGFDVAFWDDAGNETIHRFPFVVFAPLTEYSPHDHPHPPTPAPTTEEAQIPAKDHAQIDDEAPPPEETQLRLEDVGRLNWLNNSPSPDFIRMKTNVQNYAPPPLRVRWKLVWAWVTGRPVSWPASTPTQSQQEGERA